MIKGFIQRQQEWAQIHEIRCQSKKIVQDLIETGRNTFQPQIDPISRFICAQKMNKAIEKNDPLTYYKPCLKKPTLKEDTRYNFLKEKFLHLESHSKTTSMCNSRSESNLCSLSKHKSSNKVMIQSTPDLASKDQISVN